MEWNATSNTGRSPEAEMIQNARNDTREAKRLHGRQHSSLNSRGPPITSIQTPTKKCEGRKSKQLDRICSIKAAKKPNANQSERRKDSEMPPQWLQESPQARNTQRSFKGSNHPVESRPPSRQKHAFPVHLDEAWSITQDVSAECEREEGTNERERPPSRGSEELWSTWGTGSGIETPKCHSSHSTNFRNLTTAYSSLCIDDEAFGMDNEVDSNLGNNIEHTDRIKADRRAPLTGKNTANWRNASTKSLNQYSENGDHYNTEIAGETISSGWAVTRNTSISKDHDAVHSERSRPHFDRIRNPTMKRETKQSTCKSNKCAYRKLKTSLSDDFLSLFAPS
uniref:AlNc14C67G4714 protein n=1 Tax=Albugo laibachii Nc14 TaxID=890382 RepID=F0WDJ4_9STRA|nr:AlNc14C67G4714 [Albugo laibachii Nc14]|eukprot:CCA19268.1 AlNc14C67G4714 [Albugo laibachii Nc14]